MRDRWGTLLSVDDLVAGVVRNLEQQAVLDKTYILFSSDHGCASLVSPLVSLGLPWSLLISPLLFISLALLRANVRAFALSLSFAVAPPQTT